LENNFRRPRMAGATTNQVLLKNNVIYKSNLETILNILKELIVISVNMQKYIVTQDWLKVYELSEDQEKLNKSFDDSIQKLNKRETKEDKKEIIDLKSTLKTRIKEYKRIEFINSRLLKDALFAAKQKVKYFFNNDKSQTYKKDMKKDNNIWDVNNPVILDKLV
jgi:hypothetical protein